MLGKLARRIVSWQTLRGTLKEDESDVYLYAYEMLLAQIINILVAAVIAVAFRSIVPVILFLLFYIPARSFAGGYHADTNAACTLVSAGILCMMCLVVRWIPDTMVLPAGIMVSVISGVTVFILAPVEDGNKPLDETEKIRYRKQSRWIWTVQACLCFAVAAFGWLDAAAAAWCSHGVLTVMLWLGAWKNRGK